MARFKWLRIVDELEADARIQQMHRDNVAKREATRAKRRENWLKHHRKALPLAWDCITPVEGDEAEWLRLRCVEVIRRIEAQGFDWLDYLFDKGLLHYGAEFTELCAAASEAHHSQPREAYADHTNIDGVEVFHDCSFAEFLKKGQHWTDEIIAQQVAEIKDRKNPEAAAHIAAAKALAAEAQAAYDAAMRALAA